MRIYRTTFSNAALAFVKAVIAVLSLDDTIEDAVARCRKNALKLLSVPEFGPTFYEPCVSFALRDVVCECCFRVNGRW